jgi:ABC-type branched-subunit amino acid transport system ATPase component
MLKVDMLRVTYGRSVGLHDVSIEVPMGQVVAIVGPNGAGKTTLMRTVAGWLGRETAQVVAGSVFLDGTDITRLAPFKIARRGIALVPERDKIFPTLTVAEQMELSARVCGRSAYGEHLAQAIELFPGLEKHFNRPAGALSGGERQMVAIASALCAGPCLLLIDELSQGLAPAVVSSLVGRLRAIQRLGMTVLLVEQNARLALGIAAHVYVLNAGHLVASGTPDELSRSTDLAETYLGLAATDGDHDG